MHVKYINNYTSKETFLYFVKFFLKSVMFSLFSLIFIISLVALLVVGDLLYNSSKGNNVVPLVAGYVIVTESMVPTINVNDAILVKRMDQNNLKIGDIITFKTIDERYLGLTVTHRIVGTQNLSSGELVYRTKGDNNRLEDSAIVKNDNIYGKVILKLPKIGYIKDFLSSKIGFLLFVILPIGLIFLFNCKTLFMKNEEEY